MASCDNQSFPPVYKRRRERALRLGGIALVLYWPFLVAGPIADWVFDADGEIWRNTGALVVLPLMLPTIYYISSNIILKFRAIYAKSPLCPFCAAKMIASDPTAAADPAAPADPAAMFACPRCHHAASRAELKAAWRDVT